MGVLDLLARNIGRPEFTKAYRRNKVKAIEDLIGRPLTKNEKEGVRSLTHIQLTKVVKALASGPPKGPERNW